MCRLTISSKTWLPLCCRSGPHWKRTSSELVFSISFCIDLFLNDDGRNSAVSSAPLSFKKADPVCECALLTNVLGEVVTWMMHSFSFEVCLLTLSGAQSWCPLIISYSLRHFRCQWITQECIFKLYRIFSKAGLTPFLTKSTIGIEKRPINFPLYFVYSVINMIYLYWCTTCIEAAGIKHAEILSVDSICVFYRSKYIYLQFSVPTGFLMKGFRGELHVRWSTL